MRLQDKVVLITGSTQSIGKATAELFFKQGATVILSGSRNTEAGQLIANEIHPLIDYISLDVANEESWQEAIRMIEHRYGKLDALINNAGIEYPPNSSPDLQDPETCSLDDWIHVHQVNLNGVFLGCKYAIPLMKKSNAASIVNIGSRSALVGVPSSAAYSSSKAAIRNYSKTVAIHCANRGYPIRCNVIHPGAILTHMWDKELGTDDLREQRIASFSQNIPLKKMGSALDVAQAALYFASDESQFVTGTELIIDGGIMAATAASANANLISE